MRVRKEMALMKKHSQVFCVKCNRAISHDEIGLYKRLFNRGAEEFWCIHCISEYLEVPIPRLEKKIEEFRAAGCTLFSTEPTA